MLQSNCLRIATIAPWYIGYGQIHNDLGVTLFTDHSRSLRVLTHMMWGTPYLCNTADIYADRTLACSLKE